MLPLEIAPLTLKGFEMKKSIRLTLAMAALVAIAADALAVNFAKPADAIKYRQSAFSLMGSHFSDINAMLKGDIPFDAKRAALDADIVATLASMPWKAFGPGTEGGKSKPEIWKEMDKVKAGAQELEKASAELKKVAATGDVENLKKAFANTAKTCKACHDSYRDK